MNIIEQVYLDYWYNKPINQYDIDLLNIVFDNKELFLGLENKEQISFHPCNPPTSVLMYLKIENNTSIFEFRLVFDKNRNIVPDNITQIE